MSIIGNLFKTPSAPAAVDPNALIGAQTAANEGVARTNAKLNRVDSYSPFGSVTFEDLGDDRWKSTQSFSPDMQKLYDTQLSTGQGISDAAQTKLGQLPMDQFNLDGVQDYKGAMDYSGLADIPGLGDFDTARQEAEDASFNKVWDRLGSQFGDEQTALATQLANKGVTEGSEQYTKAFDRFNERKNDARTNAAYDSITAGRDAFNNLFATGMTARQQGLSERAGDVNLANQARAQQISDKQLLRSQPMNELAALLQGSPAVTTPQQQGAAGVNVAAPDVGGAYGLNASQQQNAYNQQIAQQNAAMSGAFGMASAGIGML